MKRSSLKVLAILATLVCHGSGIPFVPDFSPESLERRGEFFERMDQLWKESTREGDPPVISAATFGGDSISGKNMVSFINGRDIYAFQGFRYASAERFQIPTLVDKFWTGNSFEADHIGPICPQIGMVSALPSGQEDCLYLNVYTPDISGGANLPVMVFIHGGGFIIGDSTMYQPTRLLDHDVVLVTIHYRLGTHGFFFMDNDDAPGNFALYDQAMALDWVQNHISDFGGDKWKVTVFGQSAGGSSAAYMQISPRAKGKMHGIISQSGSTLDNWAFDTDPWYATNYIADYLDCKDASNQVDIACIKSVSSDDLVKATMNLTITDRLNGGLGFRGVSPTAQGPEVSDPILTKHPFEYFIAGEINNVNQMLGTVKQEGSYISGLMYKTYMVPNGLDQDQEYLEERMVPDLIKAMGIFDVSYALSESCILFYCPDIDMGDIDKSTYCMYDMTGALLLKGGGWQSANLLSYLYNETTNDVYFYSFDYMSDDTMYLWVVGETPFETGVTHSDELMYLFPMPAIMDGPQITIVKRMTKIWTDFATYFDPTPKPGTLSVPRFAPFRFEDYKYLLMRDEFVLESDFRLRWTITIDEMNAGEEVTPEPPLSVAPDSGHSNTMQPPETSSTTMGTHEDLQDEYDKVAEEADMYLAAMISFIIGFVIASLVAAFFWGKAKGHL